jgi:predicted PurR-regulated permease PerM
VASGAIVIAVFLMASGDLFYEKLIRIMPSFEDKKAALRIVLDVEREVSAYLISITLINAGLAAAVGLAFWAIGLPTPQLWALFAFILNYIPYLGPISGLVLSAAMGVVVFETIGQALLAPLIYGALIGLETQIITPALLSRRMRINAVMILLSLAFWAWAWGIPGIVVAVPILVTFRVLCSHIEALSAIGEFLSQRSADGEAPHRSDGA